MIFPICSGETSSAMLFFTRLSTASRTAISRIMARTTFLLSSTCIVKKTRTLYRYICKIQNEWESDINGDKDKNAIVKNAIAYKSRYYSNWMSIKT